MIKTPLLHFLGWASLALAAQQVLAQEFPTRPLRVIVVAAPGGIVDIAARTVAPHLSKALGQPVLVENRAGGGGNIATEAVAKAAADGHTLLMTGNNQAVNQTLLPNPGFDYEKDLAPVTMVARSDTLLVASNSLPANSIAELIALARQKPGALSMAAGPIGTPAHFGAVLLARLMQTELPIIGYKGVAQAFPDILSGQVQLIILTLPAGLPMVRAGKMKALAINSDKRSAMVPDIPTAAESGLAGFDVVGWACFMTTGGTAPPVVDKLSQEIRKVLAVGEVRDIFTKQGAEVWTTTPAALGAFLREDAARWAKVLKANAGQN